MRPLLALVFILGVILLSAPSPAFSLTPAEELQAKIDQQSAKIKELDAEIAKFEQELTVIGANKSSLRNEIKRLDTLRKKYSTDIQKTQREIDRTSLKITELSGAIADKELRIQRGIDGLKRTLRGIQESNDVSVVESALSLRGFDALWENIDRSSTLSAALKNAVANLRDERKGLSEARDSASEQKKTLSKLSTNLLSQKNVLDQSRTDQSKLLTETSNKESEFQKILEAKRLAKQQFEAEMLNYESQLKFIFDPTAVPATGSGILSFPFSSAVMQRCKDKQRALGNLYCITQYFGNTAFARSGAYNGKGHNGVDFGVIDGTYLYPAMPGTVTAIGNTDAYPGCYSYGKWVLVDHGNGLSSLYAHLSYIAVGKGDQVEKDTLLGYTGRTGYATGPHLHFTLYASSAVQLVKMGSVKAKTNCAGATVPVAPTAAYLNPMEYF